MPVETPRREQSTAVTTTDDLFTVLADHYRRRTIDHLQEREEPIAVTDIARAIAEEEVADSEEQGSDAKRIRAALYHKHLPLLSEEDIVTVDTDRNSIRKGESFEAVYSFLEDVRQTF